MNPETFLGITIFGTPDSDIIVGTVFSDVLRGRGGDDGISGDWGSDNIAGGRGNDQLVGGLGADTFVFGQVTGRDTIQDFGPRDLLDVSRLDITFDDVNQSTNAKGDTVITFDGFDGPNAPKIILKNAGLVQESDFIF